MHTFSDTSDALFSGHTLSASTATLTCTTAVPSRHQNGQRLWTLVSSCRSKSELQIHCNRTQDNNTNTTNNNNNSVFFSEHICAISPLEHKAHYMKQKLRKQNQLSYFAIDLAFSLSLSLSHPHTHTESVGLLKKLSFK